MHIQPQRRRNVRVAQHLTDAFNVNPIFNTAGRISVTKCDSYASGYHTDAEQIQNNIDRCGAPLAYPFGLSGYTHFVTDQKQLFSNTPSYRLEVE